MHFPAYHCRPTNCSCQFFAFSLICCPKYWKCVVHCCSHKNSGQRATFSWTISLSFLVSCFMILLFLGMAGSHMLLHWQERMVLKGTKSDAIEGHADLLIRTAWHRSPHGLIRINFSVSRSVAVCVSVHMESCTIYFYFFYFYHIRICIRMNGICPLLKRNMFCNVFFIFFCCKCCSSFLNMVNVKLCMMVVFF